MIADLELFDCHDIAAKEEHRGVTLVEMKAKSILNRCTSPGTPFRWTINPYRGCEFGCVYCYARYTHEFLDLRDPDDFERRIFVKRRAGELLMRALARTPIGSDAIAIGTATDPYQPAERVFQLTRSMLQVFASLGGLELSLTTKSALITRDLDLLTQINRRSRLSVNFSLITLDRKLQRLLEPRAPRPPLRLAALRTLREAGIRCNVLIMPVLPGITDSEGSLDLLIAAASAAGANGVWWRTLFLKPAAARKFVPFIERNFPRLRERYDAFYATSAYAPRAYNERLGSVFDQLRRRYGFPLDREPIGQNSSAAAHRPAIQLHLAG
ncbi:MAG: radical SAM protein [Candidatus Binataceae bacterium]|nr:radical SAM protein [Candidatus Binataceae bacterium]